VFRRRIESGDTVHESELVVAIHDAYPVSEGHLLVVPRRHTPDYFTMTEAERLDSDRLVRVARNHLLSQDDSITGFNVGSNAGVVSGQTVFHAHIHLIPRRDGDTPSPRGGVRGVIPEKMSY
jgi:diadenosine tetraphosphate (Ap4A) HIT family hydrolase